MLYGIRISQYLEIPHNTLLSVRKIANLMIKIFVIGNCRPNLAIIQQLYAIWRKLKANEFE